MESNAMLENVVGNWRSLLGLSLLLLLAAVWQHYQRCSQYRRITSVRPTYYGLPFIGIAFKFLNLKNVFPYIDACFEKNNADMVCLWVKRTPIILTIDPVVIKRVTSAPEFIDKAPQLYLHFKNPVINGIIVSESKKWKHDRRIFNRFVAHNNLMKFIPTFNVYAQMNIELLDTLVGRGEQEVYEIFKKITLRLSIDTVMGISEKETAGSYDQLLKSIMYLLDQMREHLLFAAIGLPFLARTPKYYKTLNFLHNYMLNIIKNNDNNNKSDSSDDTKSNKFIDTVMQCLRMGSLTTDNGITECATMITASLETSTLATYATLFFIAMHPEVQEKLFQEIKSVFPKKNTPVEYEHLKNLPYLDMVWAETLRLAPPVPVIGRQASKTTELKPGLMIPKGMQIVLPIISLHRSKQFWGAHPERFDPEHFTPENIKKRPSHAYMPFSKGSRNCLGYRYAEISISITLIHLVRNFKFSTSFKMEDLVLLPRVSLDFGTEPLLSIERRD